MGGTAWRLATSFGVSGRNRWPPCLGVAVGVVEDVSVLEEWAGLELADLAMG